MKPSDAELKTIAERYARAYGSEESRTVVWLAKAELQRRQQQASVPAELVDEFYRQASTLASPSDADTPDAPAVVVRAPDQIWLCVGDMYDCRGCEVEFDDIKSSFEVSWCEEQIDESDVKYVRADLYEKLEAELQRRQQPASVPAELVDEFYRQASTLASPCDAFLAGARYAEIQRRANPESMPESVRRLMKYAGKQRREVSNPCITANEAIEIASYFAAYGREQSQWVPVSERLPEDGKTVIFWIRPAGYASVGKLDIDSRCFHSVGGWVNQDDVSHWMPLPEPPTC